jgi:Mg2+/Co2+ transporter CorB
VSVYLLLSILVILVFISAFFTASEIGVMSLNRYRLRHLVKKEHPAALRIQAMLARPERLLSMILIANTLSQIIASSIATLLGHDHWGPYGVIVAEFLLTLVLLIFGEMLPKTLGAMYPQKIAFGASRYLAWSQRLLAPLIMLVTSISNWILRVLGLRLEALPKDSLSSEELQTMLAEAGSLLPHEHRHMMISLLDIEKATVEDIMIPKADLIGLNLEEPWHLVLQQLKTAQHTRLPLYHGTVESVVGLVHVRSVLHLALDDELTLETLLDAAESPYFIPESTTLNQQIVYFRQLKKRSAFVVDEYGELQGLVTMEDILEEIVGEFTTDVADLNQDMVLLEDGGYLMNASLTLREVNRALHWNLPLIGPKTLSGLIIEKLGYIPPSECCLRLDDYLIEIMKVQDNLIRTIKMWRLSERDS